MKHPLCEEEALSDKMSTLGARRCRCNVGPPTERGICFSIVPSCKGASCLDLWKPAAHTAQSVLQPAGGLQGRCHKQEGSPAPALLLMLHTCSRFTTCVERQEVAQVKMYSGMVRTRDQWEAHTIKCTTSNGWSQSLVRRCRRAHHAVGHSRS